MRLGVLQRVDTNELDRVGYFRARDRQGIVSSDHQRPTTSPRLTTTRKLSSRRKTGSLTRAGLAMQQEQGARNG